MAAPGSAIKVRGGVLWLAGRTGCVGSGLWEFCEFLGFVSGVAGEWVLACRSCGQILLGSFLDGGLGSGCLAFGMGMAIVCDLDQTLDHCNNGLSYCLEAL